MSSSKKLLVVFGATGIQGGSVIRSILGDPSTAAEFSIRAITRDPTKPSAKALTEQGVECVAADLDDKDTLRAALQGAYAVFSVTNFWEKMSGAVEIQQGKNVADIAKEVGVEHFIWSSLLNITKLSNGMLSKVTHFDSKATVEEYIRKIGLPASFFLPGFYMSNLIGSMMRPDDKGVYQLAFPTSKDSPFPMFDTRKDSGVFVKGILKNREKTLGKRIYAATEYKSPAEIVREFTEVTGKEAVYNELPPDVFKGFLEATGMPAEEMCQNLQLMGMFGYYGGADLKESQEIVEEPLTTWKEFVMTHNL